MAENRFRLVRVGMRPSGKKELFRDVVRQLHESGVLREEEAPLRCLLDREEVSSTAIGKGVALPHARCPVVTELTVSAVRLAPALDFDAPDGDPVDLVFMILGPEEPPGDHVVLLGRIARMISVPGTLDALRQAPDESSLRRMLEEGMATQV